MSEAQVVAFIDLGTNSVRLMLARVNPDHSYEVLSQQKETVRLGEGAFLDNQLQPGAMGRAIQVCKQFAEMARANGACEIIAVATAAVREAENQADLIDYLREEAELDVRVISGREEARLIYLGVVSGLNIGNRKAAFIDVGGGSTELIVGDQRGYDLLDTLKLGSIRLTNMFLPNETGPISTGRYSQMQTYVRNASVRTAQNVKQYPTEFVMGSSGTILNLAQIAYQLKKTKERDILPLNRLKQIVRMLCSMTLEERRRVPGINPERADIIIGGAAIVETLMTEIGLDSVRVSDRGLREGMLVEYLTRIAPVEESLEQSLRTRSILRLGRLCRFDEAHAYHVAHLALELFDSAREIGLHSMNGWSRELLYYSALLHDLGTFLTYTNHQYHSYYFIRNADLLGFDQKEINLMAALALYHRKQFPRKKHPEFAVLDTESQNIVRTNCIFLRIAEALDRSHTGLVKRARFHLSGKEAITLDVEARGEAQLEIWGVQNYERSFQRAFGRTLKVCPQDAEN
jgi:exopolyphosphatase/guanosine-5'-triphosphate,3'-diphosphate pyrophosphatase